MKDFNVKLGEPPVTYEVIGMQVSRYQVGNGVMIRLMCDEGWGAEPLADVTVNLPAAPASGCIWLKDYSENAGMADSLKELGWVSPTGRTEKSGWVTIEEYRLEGELKEYVDSQLALIPVRG